MAGTKISQLQDLDIITGLENVVLQKDTANNKCSLNKIKEFTIKDTQLKEDGKGLSTNDFTNEDKLKLDSALTQIKTINGQSLVGEGNIDIQGGSGINDAPVDDKKYVRQNSAWVEETKIDTSSFATTSDIADVTSLLKTVGDAIQLGNPDKTLNINSKDGDVRINSYYYLPVMEAYPDDPSRRAIVLKNHDSLTGTSTTGDGATLIMLSKWDVVDVGSNKYRTNINAKDSLVTINDNSRILYSKEEAKENKLLSYDADGAVISSDIKTINGESLIGSGNIELSGVDKEYVDTSLTHKSNKKIKSDLSGPYTNLVLSDNSFYNLTDINTYTEINIQLTPSDTINGKPTVGEYVLTFTTQDAIPTITLPDNIKWIGDHTIEANKSYILAITDNFAVLGGA